MKKKYRIKKADEFTTIIKGRKYYPGNGIVLYVNEKKEAIPRVGITVKKKIGNAVIRNKVKRQIRMMISEIYDFDENFDSIILVKEDFLKNNYKNNKKNLERLYKQVKMNG
ncbi:ribonuclease P protein component [Breznakia sp. PF5-3]|uniref:ribonuclease P protein component n=1 Tax=unclassified Breznakia TaxID=2623764 RepID=UPI0024076BB4|nr:MULTISPECIES: ribonuclease P protein component [unclassified Breznakia]MDL2276023.1 ribonuclease P protein component [Breznakia sp. OttesenSCG-928-G09]MDF9824334.1 ribonuclease P protein component [Breznakia sp. PM6-1]MDF9835075.1 ribonuclease P protein component [Breznakia sp. PF5-3]MDF9837754.1 ribonuclease P protein component [Breznakia sp. PFB2-8]MDF9859633.1 ribonuclease P protein component [Breznakia sp. PH5-24]